MPAGSVVSYDEVKVGLYKPLSALQCLLGCPFFKLDLLQDEDCCAVSSYRDGNDFFLKYGLSTNCSFEMENRRKKCSLDSILNVSVSFCNVRVSSATDKLYHGSGGKDASFFFFFFIL